MLKDDITTKPACLEPTNVEFWTFTLLEPYEEKLHAKLPLIAEFVTVCVKLFAPSILIAEL